MLASDLVKPGLTGCDVNESESNGNCEVVINVHTGRLVALQPNDILGVYKKKATTERLQDHLATMHRQVLYSRYDNLCKHKIQGHTATGNAYR